jgi:hypothetical protein
MYSQRVTVHPRPDKIAEARALLLARVKTTQASGQRVAFGELVVGRHAPEFQVTLLFDDLAAFEAQRKRNQADASFRTFGTKLAATLRKPVGVDLFEIHVAMPGTGSAPKAARARKK